MRIVWRGNFDVSGFGRTATDYVMALKKLGADINIINVSPPSIQPASVHMHLHPIEIKANKRDDILVQHVPPKDIRMFDATVNICCTTFESPKLPHEWIRNLTSLDGIIVPSGWNKEILVNHGVNATKVHVVPYIINYLSLDPARIKPLMIRNKKEFSFLSIFDFTYRKGWDLLLEAYWTEFRPDEDVSLILKTYHRNFNKSSKLKIYEYINDLKSKLKLTEIPQTLIYDFPLDSHLLASLYKACQAYVLPSRGEGFSLTHAEAMALAIPTIGSHYGGNLDFMSYYNSSLVKIKSFIEMDKKQLELSPHYENLPLAEPSLHHLRETMRQVYVHYDNALEKAYQARLDIKEKCNEIKIGLKLLETIETIAH